MHPLASKTARVGLIYASLCGLLLWASLRERLSLAADWRYAALRELMLEEAPAPDVIFLGSSRTARGLAPAAFDARWAEVAGGPVRSLNLAIMGIPKRIGYQQLRSWLRDHEPPRILCMEMGLPDLAEYPHQMASRFVDPGDALRLVVEQPFDHRGAAEYDRRRKRPPPFDPGGILRSLDRNALHLELALEGLGRGPEDVWRLAYNGARNLLEGRGARPYWARWPPIHPADLARQVDARGWYRVPPASPEGRQGKEKVARILDREPGTRTEDFDAPGRFRGPRLYARLLAELCRERGIRLVFVDLPGFREDALSPSHVAYHESLAEVFRPDLSRLQREELYQDPGHLSPDGARWFSRRLASFLAAP